MKETKDKKRVGSAVYALILPVVFIGGALFGANANISVLNRNGTSNKDDLDYSSVEEAYDTLTANFDGEIDKAKIIDGLKKGMAEATGDPYTEYFSAEDSKEFKEQISGSFTGIGAELGKENNAIIVVTPIKGFPAEKAGLKSKDIILKINDEDALSFSINDAVTKIRGEAGTTVKLAILRGSEQLEFTITREEIKIPSVEYEVLEGSIGYIRISRFSDDTDTLVKEAAKNFRDQNVSRVVLDLRNNPGGFLDQSIKVASHWIDSGQTVVVEKRSGKVIKDHKAVRGQEFKGMKTVVLINEGSASASEIVSGALKDYGAATLVGIKSYGKGSVQEVDELGNGSSLKITIARWFTPKDKNIDKEGIEPDEKVEITADQAKAGEDPQKARALEIVKQ